MPATSNRRFERPAKSLVYLPHNAPRFLYKKEIVILEPPVNGGEAKPCVIELTDNDGHRRLLDAAVVLPSDAVPFAMDFDPAVAAALALSATVHRTLVSEFNSDTANRKLFRTMSFKGKIKLPFHDLENGLFEKLGQDVEALLQIAPSNLRPRIEDIRGTLALMHLADIVSWQPRFIAADKVSRRTDLAHQWWMIQNWTQLEGLTWERCRKLMNRKLPADIREHDAENLRRKCFKIGLERE